jgi:hypothetical protein
MSALDLIWKQEPVGGEEGLSVKCYTFIRQPGDGSKLHCAHSPPQSRNFSFQVKACPPNFETVKVQNWCSMISGRPVCETVI